MRGGAHLDHLVIGAASLAEGATAFEAWSGVAVPPGGRHPRMGTHNRLTRLGDGAFLEIIAIDPAASPPPRPRWYGLDGARVRARLANGPRLLSWVVAVDDLDAALARIAGAGVDAGEPVEQTRGELRWRFAVRADGELVEGGAFPALIEWPPGSEAAARMPDLGLRLTSLRATHPEPERIGAALVALGAADLVTLSRGEPGVAATLVHGGRTVELL